MRRTKPLAHSATRVGRSSSGLGLFAIHTIKPGQYIEYVGKMITNEKADAMKGARYLFEVNARWTIEGSQRSNVARYINHACAPNCESVRTGKRVFIKAIQNIKPGEELTYDYGDEYVDEFIRPHGCRCRKCT